MSSPEASHSAASEVIRYHLRQTKQRYPFSGMSGQVLMIAHNAAQTNTTMRGYLFDEWMADVYNDVRREFGTIPQTLRTAKSVCKWALANQELFDEYGLPRTFAEIQKLKQFGYV